MRVLVGSLIVAGALLLLSPAAACGLSAGRPGRPRRRATCSTSRACWAATPRAVREAIDRLVRRARRQGLRRLRRRVHRHLERRRTGPTRPRSRSGLGDRDLLLAIATDERDLRVSVADDFPLTDDELADVAGDDAHPGAARRRLGGRGDRLRRRSRRTRWRRPPCRASSAGSWSPGVGTALIVGAVRRRREKKKVEDAAAADVKTLEQRAGILLVQLDDALKTSEQELGFAQAQFGDAQTKDFARRPRRREGDWRSRRSRCSRSSTTRSPRRPSSTAR